MARLRVAVLVSGFGSNLQALIDLCAEPGFPAEIVVVISNKPGVMALERAATAGIKSHVIPHRGFPTREAFEQTIDTVLRDEQVELVCLAGFMRIFTPGFVAGWHDKILNIHPALLPSFRGLDTHRRALDAGVRFHGCTVHVVRADLDNGPIVVQAAVPVLPDDDEARLAERVRQAEYRAYPLALRLFAEGRVTIEGERAVITGETGPAGATMLNPPDLPITALVR